MEAVIDYIAYVCNAYSPWKILSEFFLIIVVVYSVIRFLRGTGGANLLKGLVILLIAVFVLNALTRELQLDRISLLFKYFLLAALLVATVSFQPELRRGLMQLGGAWMGRSTAAPAMQGVVEQIVDAVAVLSRDRIGALIALERQVGLTDLTQSGTPMDSQVNAELLRTIFWPGTPLHDMGVVIRHGRLAAAAVQFPLAEHGEFDRMLGSRHRSAIGLSNQTDAVVVVVSEETGQIGLAVDGKLARFLTLEQLRRQLLDLMMPLVDRKNKAVPAAEPSDEGDAAGPARAGLTGLKLRQMAKTAAMVALLSVMIWFFAERAVLTEAKMNVKLSVPTARDDILVAFVDKEGRPVAYTDHPVSATVLGPAGRIQQVSSSQYEYAKSIDLSATGFDPAGGAVQNRTVSPEVLLGGRIPFKESYLRVSEVAGGPIHLRIWKLVKQSLPVDILDAQGNPLTPTGPVQIEAWVLPDQAARAEVRLSDDQIAAAVGKSIEVTAAVALPNRVVSYPVRLSLQRGAPVLPQREVTNVRFHISLPYTMLDQYRVVIDPTDLDHVLDEYSPIRCRGAGAEGFINARYHLVLDVDEDDRARGGGLRPLRYHIPEGIGQLDIIDRQSKPMPFRLEKLVPAPTVPAVPGGN